MEWAARYVVHDKRSTSSCEAKSPEAEAHDGGADGHANPRSFPKPHRPRPQGPSYRAHPRLYHGCQRLALPHVRSWRKRTIGGGRGMPVMTHLGPERRKNGALHSRVSPSGPGPPPSQRRHVGGIFRCPGRAPECRERRDWPHSPHRLCWSQGREGSQQSRSDGVIVRALG